ncbi:mannose-1-phosphate guanyltransferase beta [Histomonas meleagridis]|uniref:mannose-1-phosphate guanyltransferase beta n=1 Tax=Histomonas meleagridis TaxID=135588 RepID=UPI00355ABB0D|nr:mannose-1-phosphate guanyltransferase beta [Histomonas meleagridis]KAH0807195.1 mannose-1-phosphate guanyltransferase beta [Histomonas meleagridis]
MAEDLPLAALVLVGGFGTRFRPLTFSRSKPLVEFCNKPMVEYMLDALTEVGCKKIVFALSELQSDFKEYIGKYQKNHPTVEIIPSIENSPMGTAGPIALAKEHLKGHRFFMLNSDVISKYPFKDLLEFHVKHGGEGTIMSWDVEDPSRFGVILSDENHRIQRFVEKPQTFVGRSINAGHYIFEPSVIDRVKPVPTSIEREIFPQMASEGKLFVMKLEGYWMDIGTPSAYLSCIPIFLKDKDKVMIDETATIGKDCQIGPNVVIGPGVVIGDGCCIENSVILANSKIGKFTFIQDTIVGWESKVGSWVHLEGLCVFGLDVTIKDKLVLKGAVVCPHKAVDKSILQPTIII